MKKVKKFVIPNSNITLKKVKGKKAKKLFKKEILNSCYGILTVALKKEN